MKMSRAAKATFSIVTLALTAVFLMVVSTSCRFKNQDKTMVKESKGKTAISGPDVGEGGNDNDQFFRSLTISRDNPDLIYVGSEGNGIFKSLDGGKTWSWLRNGLKYYRSAGKVGSYPEIYDIAIDSSGNLVYAGTTGSPGPPTGNCPSAIAGVYKSDDGGKSWVQKIKGITNSSIGCIAIDPTNLSTVYIGTKGGRPTFTRTDVDDKFFAGGILKSTDGGENWHSMDLPEPSSKSEFWKVIIVDSQTIFALGLSDKDPKDAVGILKTTDGGESWMRISPKNMQIFHFDVSLQDSNIICAMGRDEYIIYKSIDGGSSWSSIPAQANGPIRISPFDSNTIFYCDAFGIYKSKDGLQNSTKVMAIDKTVSEIEFDYTNPNVVYFGTDGLLIYKSEDSGNSFSILADLRDFINKNEDKM